MQHRNDDLLVFIAIGDAVAAATEYVKPEQFPTLINKVLRLDGYHQHPTHRNLYPGRYTDDTQCSIAVSEAILDGRVLSTTLFAEHFAQAFNRDPRAGYARGFQSVLERANNGKELQNILGATNPRTGKPWRCSPKNGGCMRAVPCGVLPSPTAVMEASAIQARVTHDTHEGVFAAQAVALMSHFSLHTNKPFNEMLSFLMQWLEDDLRTLALDLKKPRVAPVYQPARHTVHAVFHLLTRCTTLSQILRGAVRLGGDTDSVAAISLGIASCRMEDDLPAILTYMLEPWGEFGTTFLRSMGQRLMDA